MKVAVFSDIQANLPAMQTVSEHILAWQPDLVVMNGDLINRGPRSLDCLQMFCDLQAKHNWVALRGNHEDFVKQCYLTPPESPVLAEIRQFADWTAQQLGAAIEVTDTWGDHFCFHAKDAQDAWVYVTHGSIQSNRQGILTSTTDAELATRIPQGVRVFVTGHTHRALVREYAGTIIVNAGSAGSPFDDDPRAAYAQLEYVAGDWQAKVVRIPYDREAADRDFFETGFLQEGGPIARLIYEEWRRATGLMPLWHRQYQCRVENGELELATAAEQFLASLPQ